jgi:hypothetical protein
VCCLVPARPVLSSAGGVVIVLTLPPLRIQIVYFDFSIFGLYNWLVDNDGLIHIRFHGLTSSC